MIEPASLSAPDRDRLLVEVRRHADLPVAATESTPFDNVYRVAAEGAVSPAALLFCAAVGDARDNPIERGIILPPWDAAQRAGRDGLVPPLGFYHDHDGVLFRCALAYLLNTPLALHGHTGVGKTELVRYFAALLGAPLYRSNLHGLSTTDDIIGKLLPVGEGRVGFQDGLVTTAVRRGGILLLEEMNATGQEIWFSLHGLLDQSRALTLVEKDNEVVHQHTSCRIYSTFNPAEYPTLYPGTKELSAAYLRRWASVRMGFLDLRMERAILTKRFPQLETDPDLAAMVDAMLEVARVCREILQQQTHTFAFVMSTGVLEAWVRLALHVGPVGAARMAFYDLLDERMKSVFKEQILAYVTPWDLAGLEG